MTAIYGLWRFDGRDAAADFKRMDSALLRYGGDDHHTIAAGLGLAMGRHLLFCLPEDCFSAPGNQSERYIVVGDVRLTEREDLASQLGLGVDVRQMSDSTIAALAIDRWNEGAFDRIYGDFAIAAWDRQEHRLLLARDHLGHKPLFFHRGDGFFAFASMPAGLQALPDVPLGPDLDSMKRFLALWPQSPGKSHYEGIGRVMPGHFAIATPDGVVQTRYWKPDLTPLRLPTSQDYADGVREHLDRAVSAALRGAEGIVGAHLSSGLDSTAVATTAARQLAPKGGRVVAYTAAPREGYDRPLPGRIVDESVLASLTAAMHPNMEHVIVRSDRTPMANLDRTASIYGVPVLNICNEGWFDAINDDAAKRGITVMLEGALGNGTISESGILALPELLQQGRFLTWLKLVGRMLRKRRMGAARILWLSFSQCLPNRLYEWLYEKHYGALGSAIRGTALKEKHFRTAMRGVAAESPVAGSSRRMLPSGWLRRPDNSLSNRLELLSGDDGGPACKGMLGEWKIDYRDPTTDRRLVEFTFRIPAEEFISDGIPRTVARRALADRVPAEVLDTPLRGYQAADWHEWLNKAREEITAELDRIEMFEPSSEIIDTKRMRALVANWPDADSEQWLSMDAVMDYRCTLLRAVSAASFMRHAARSNY